jgi:pimeloyl-ACP methyl ester carboxylesterase
MKMLIAAVVSVAAFLLGGCSRSDEQPYMTASRLDRGLVIVLTGIEGRSPFNEAIVSGLAKGGVKYAVKLEDWPQSWFALYNQETVEINHAKARRIAEQIVRYRLDYPDRPVVLVGQSGGAAIAAWVTESLQGQSVDGVIMLAASISPKYRLDRALARSERGIVSFYSKRDLVVLWFGTSVLGTMDREHKPAAGLSGFEVPLGRPACYNKLFQIPWGEKMGKTGNAGLHLTSGAEDFVAQYVAPFVLSYSWDERFVTRVLNRPTAVSNQTTLGKLLSSK